MSEFDLTCPKCGFENTEESAFCSKCGSKLKRNEAKQSNKKNVVYLIVIAVLAMIILSMSYYIFFVVGNQEEIFNVVEERKIESVRDTEAEAETETEIEKDREIETTNYTAEDTNESEITTITSLETESENNYQPKNILHVAYSPDNNLNATDQELKEIKQVISNRLDVSGVSDYSIEIDYYNDRIFVHIPVTTQKANTDTAQMAQDLGRTNRLIFREGIDVDSDGRPQGITEENVIITRDDILLAYPTKYEDPSGEFWAVSIELTDEGTEKFAEATKRIAFEEGTISIWIDDIVISAPTVQSAITNGKLQISGSFDVQSATKLADEINAGAMPFALQIIEYSVVSTE